MTYRTENPRVEKATKARTAEDIYLAVLGRLSGPVRAWVEAREDVIMAIIREEIEVADSIKRSLSRRPHGPNFEITPGAVVYSVTERALAPFPKAKRTATIDKWLIKEAVLEARSRGDDFNLLQFEGLKKLSPADRAGMNDYLFQREPVEPAPMDRILTDLEPVSEPGEIRPDNVHEAVVMAVDQIFKDRAAGPPHGDRYLYLVPPTDTELGYLVGVHEDRSEPPGAELAWNQTIPRGLDRNQLSNWLREKIGRMPILPTARPAGYHIADTYPTSFPEEPEPVEPVVHALRAGSSVKAPAFVEYLDEYTTDDYPYGRSRTTARFYVDRSPRYGERVCKQTTNPKTGRVNKPKCSTYGLKAKVAIGEDGRTYMLVGIDPLTVAVYDHTGKSSSYARGGEDPDVRFAELHEAVFGSPPPELVEPGQKPRAGDPPWRWRIPPPELVEREPEPEPVKPPEVAQTLRTGLPWREADDDFFRFGYLTPPDNTTERNPQTGEYLHPEEYERAKVALDGVVGIPGAFLEGVTLENLGEDIYADKVPPRVKKHKGEIAIKQSDKSGKVVDAEVDGNIYEGGQFAVFTEKSKGAKRVSLTFVAAGMAAYYPFTIQEADFFVRLATATGETFDHNDPKSLARLREIVDFMREENNQSFLPIWKRHAKANTELNYRRRVAKRKAESEAAAAEQAYGGVVSEPEEYTDLESVFKRALVFASKDEGRPNIQGVLIDDGGQYGQGYAIATDGHRLAKIPISTGFDPGHYNKDQEIEPDLTFPAYKRVVPDIDTDRTYTFTAEGLRKVAELAVSSRSTLRYLELHPTDWGYEARGDHTFAINRSALNDFDQAPYGGTLRSEGGTSPEDMRERPKTVSLNPRFVVDALRGATGVVGVQISDSYAPIMFYREDGEIQLIMPLRR